VGIDLECNQESKTNLHKIGRDAKAALVHKMIKRWIEQALALIFAIGKHKIEQVAVNKTTINSY